MAISEEDAVKLINHIESVARKSADDSSMQGVNDMLDQWRSDVEAGRPVERKLRVKQSPGLDILAGTPRSESFTRGDFIGKEEYKKVEQLDMLVSALGVAFLSPHMMASYILDTVSDCGGEATGKAKGDVNVRLLGVGDKGEDDATLVLSRAAVLQSHEATSQLAQIMSEIVEEAELTPRKLVNGIVST